MHMSSQVIVSLNYKLVRRKALGGLESKPSRGVLVRPKFGTPVAAGKTYVMHMSRRLRCGTHQSCVAASRYKPRPLDTSDVHLPPHIVPLVEMLAENTHEVWAQSRMQQGWKFGPERNDALKTHNGLVPYLFLTEDEKRFDRNTATQAVKLLLTIGYDIVPGRHRSLGATLTSTVGLRTESKPTNT